MYGFAGGDPVNNQDPTGNSCERKSAERLVCTNVGPGDFRTASDFLGGEAGASAYRTFEEAGLTKWGSNTCRGGFSHAQCGQLATVQSRLTLHADQACSRLGTRSTRRFQAGKFGYEVGMIHRWYFGDKAAIGLSTPGRTTLSSELFTGGSRGGSDLLLFLTNVHEEEHHTGLFGRGQKAAFAVEGRCG